MDRLVVSSDKTWSTGEGMANHFSILTLRGSPDSSIGKEFACNAGEPSSIPGLGRSTGEGEGYPLQYSGLENSINYSPWGRKESDTTERLSLSRLLNCIQSVIGNLKDTDNIPMP